MAKKTNEMLKPIDQFRLTKDWIRNEESLFSSRFTWFLAIEGFTFTAYAITQAKFGLNEFQLIRFILPLFGIFVAYTLYYPLDAALRTIDGLLEKEKEFLKNNPSFQLLKLENRDSGIHYRSWVPVKHIQYSIAVIWSLLWIAGNLPFVKFLTTYFSN